MIRRRLLRVCAGGPTPAVSSTPCVSAGRPTPVASGTAPFASDPGAAYPRQSPPPAEWPTGHPTQQSLAPPPARPRRRLLPGGLWHRPEGRWRGNSEIASFSAWGTRSSIMWDTASDISSLPHG